MNVAFVLLLHAGYWLLYTVLICVVCILTRISAHQPTNLLAFISTTPFGIACYVPNVVAFYIFYFWVFAKFVETKRFVMLALVGIACCAAAAMIGHACLILFFGWKQPYYQDPIEFLMIGIGMTMIAGIHASVALVIRGFVHWFQEMRSREDRNRAHFENELAALRSQLPPHFLFNAINNIDVLIESRPALASEYLHRLSDLLRYILYQAKETRGKLSLELEHIENYVRLQQISLPNPDVVSFRVLGDAKGASISPLLLFPYIENAFKHLCPRDQIGGIQIKLQVSDDTVSMDCRNRCRMSGELDGKIGGLGNAIANRRLKMLYPEQHQIRILRTMDEYCVQLTVNLNGA